MAAVDIVIVKQDDGSFQSSPFFVRFPQRSKIRRVITVQVNGKKISCPGCELIVDPDHNYAYFSVETRDNPQVNDSQTSSIPPSSPSGIIVGNNKTIVNVVQSDETATMIAQYRKKSLPPLPKKTNEIQKPPSDLLYEDDKSHNNPTSPSSMSPKDLPPLPKKTLPQNLIIKTENRVSMLATSPEENEELRREEREMIKEMEQEGEDPDDEEKEIQRMVEEETSTSRSRSRTGAVFQRPRSGSNPRKSRTMTPTADEESGYYTAGSPSKVGYMDKWLKSIDQETHPEHRLRPSKEYLDLIHSHMTDGRSSISFIDPNGGLEPVKAYIFEFSPQDKIIISDIDGTITKSDIMGQVYSRMGKDYTHPGIAKLFQSIAENNYRFIYLSARPITMSQLTREYINSVYQDGYKMPPGPIITSPNKAFSALAREVVIRRPETFKINCLSSIASLFPTDFPFYCGFGNRPTDCISYVSVNIDPTRCYRINKQGKLLVQATKVTYNSYAEIESQLLKHFPKVVNKHQRSQSDCFRLSGGKLVSMNLPKKKDIDLLRDQYMDPEELQV